MNPNQLLNRIFSLARRVPDSSPNDMPFGLETTILAHWREARRSTSVGLLRGLRWAALGACAIAAVTATVEGKQIAALRNRYDPATQIADSALSAGYGYE